MIVFLFWVKNRVIHIKNGLRYISTHFDNLHHVFYLEHY